MAGATAKFPMRRWIFTRESYEFESSGESEMNLSDTVFEFLYESGEWSRESSGCHGYSDLNKGIDEDEERENDNGNVEDDKSFWETQHQVLHGTLCRSSSLESRIRNATKEALKDAKLAGNFCVCRRPASGGCRNCLMREICGRLRNSGFNCAICKSKWRSSLHIPSGEHTFLDVVENSNLTKGEIRVIIELNFRAEFEIPRASEEYKQLIQKLPEVFVGKMERLHSLIKILCSAAKKCMKENKMHMGPWRKHKYMQAKWLSAAACETAAAAVVAATSHHRPEGFSGRAVGAAS